MRAPTISRSLRVMHLTDLHGRSLGAIEEAVLRSMDEEKPDVIVLTGDTSDRGTLGEYAPFLERLRAPLGVFAVKGNWEHWRPARDETAVYRHADIRLLVNEAQLLTDDTWIVGFDDATGGSPEPDRALRDVPRGATILALMHSPELFDRVAGRVSVAFGGHTHGGQVRVPMLGPLWLPEGSGRYVDGGYELRGSSLYVSRGLGTSVLPLRFWCRPELAIVDVVH